MGKDRRKQLDQLREAGARALAHERQAEAERSAEEMEQNRLSTEQASQAFEAATGIPIDPEEWQLARHFQVEQSDAGTDMSRHDVVVWATIEGVEVRMRGFGDRDTPYPDLDPLPDWFGAWFAKELAKAAEAE
jgi:hypothetical protein